ncbi:UNVERIFIED_CONTAM: hypothetical protein GTU68_004245 [Idotea baltica]|nr:hypothetical protein [Idotea baltica]
MDKIINQIYRDVLQEIDYGETASYIPELAHVDGSMFGGYIYQLHDEGYGFGDHNVKFSIQSIAKVFALILAYRTENAALWSRVGVEPSGNAFNSLSQLEYETGKPRNPFINSGALVICDVLCSSLKDPCTELLEFIREVSGIAHLSYSDKIAASERETGFRNQALIYLMKDLGNINNDVDQVLDLYFHLCSIEMTCQELAQSFSFLGNRGRSISTNKPIITVSMSKRIIAMMQTCGFYDEAGEFAFKVGLPGKSGVGGGIIAILPGQYTMAVWSPKLNKKGNSFKGMRFLELFTSATETSVF